MARKVFISSDMSVDERVAEVAADRPDLALLWPWLLTAFDDWGRAEGHPVRLKAKVFPLLSNVSPEIITEALAAFAQAGLLIRYTQNAHEYLAVPAEKWWRYQTHIHHSKHETDRSKCPPPPANVDSERPAEVRGSARRSAKARGIARKSAKVRGIGTIIVPSPSPSPSLTPPKDKAKARAVRARGREARSADDPAQDLPTASPRSTPLPSPMPFRASQSDGETIPRASGMNPLADDPKSLSGLLRAYHDQYPGSDQATDGRRIGRWIRDYGADQVAWAFDELWAQRAQGKSVQKPLAYVQSVLQGAVARDPPRTRIEAHNQAVLQAFLADTDDEEEGQPYDPAARSTNPRDAGQRVPSRATDPEPGETLASHARRSADGPGGRGDGTPYSTQ